MSDDHRKKQPPLFWWLLANILAIAFAITAWVVCLNLFRDPTNPTSYNLMMKVGRIDPLEAFTSKTAPSPQKVSSPQKLETQFKGFGKTDLETLNREFRRAYLSNYKKPKYLTYVEGEFEIKEIRELNSEDFLSPGVVVKVQALVRPDSVSDPIPYPVFAEVIFPTKDAALESFSVGNTLMLKKQRDRAAILNVGTTDFEDRTVLFLTLIPLASENFQNGDMPSFKITPPAKANLKASLPTFP